MAMVDRKLPERAFVFVGGASIVLALLGVFYNAVFLFGDYSSLFKDMKGEVEQAEFYTAFYVMSGICIAFYVALFVTGIQLIRKKTGWAFGLLAIVGLEFLYYVVVGLMWTSTTYGYSVAAASGVSSGGLMFQVFVLFPLWGPLIALWSRGQLVAIRVERSG